MSKLSIWSVVLGSALSFSSMAYEVDLKDTQWKYLLQGANGEKLKTNYFGRQPFHEAVKSLRSLSANHLKAYQEDPDYACRFPAQYSYLKARLGDPFPKRDCQVNPVVRLSGPAPFLYYTDLNPERIFEARYMIASKGKETVSRFGHAMVHLVRCAPETKFGPECRKDIDHHIVVSYRGQVDELKMSSVKGITGEYRIQPFFYLLPKSINEYTGEQDRSLTSHLLNLSKAELANLVYRLVEDYWVYRNGYNFINTNCATEVRDVLKSVRQDKRFSHKLSLMPYGVLADLMKAKFITTSEAPIFFESMDKTSPRAQVLKIEADLIKRRTQVALELKKANPDQASSYEKLYEQIQQQYIHERRALGYGIPLEGEIPEDSSELQHQMNLERLLLKEVDQDPRIQELLLQKTKIKL